MGCKCSKDCKCCKCCRQIPSQEKIRDIITRALEGSLIGYKVYERPMPHEILELTRLGENLEPTRVAEILEPTRVLEVKRSDNKIIVTPDSTGTFLTHGLLNTKYDLYAAVNPTTNAVNRTTHSVVFLYQWEALKDQIFVTCPYIPDPNAGSQIPCVVVNITNALRERNPVRAVMEVLEKIITDDFKWVMHGAVNDFTISAPEEKIFWRDIEGSRDIRPTDNDSIRLTDNDSIKLVLELEVV